MPRINQDQKVGLALNELPTETLEHIFSYVIDFVDRKGHVVRSKAVRTQYQTIQMINRRIREVTHSLAFDRILMKQRAPILHSFYIMGRPSLQTMIGTVRIEYLFAKIADQICQQPGVSGGVQTGEKKLIVMGLALLISILRLLIYNGYPSNGWMYKLISDSLPTCTTHLLIHVWQRLINARSRLQDAMVGHLGEHDALGSLWICNSTNVMQEMWLATWYFRIRFTVQINVQDVVDMVTFFPWLIHQARVHRVVLAALLSYPIGSFGEARTNIESFYNTNPSLRRYELFQPNRFANSDQCKAALQSIFLPDIRRHLSLCNGNHTSYVAPFLQPFARVGEAPSRCSMADLLDSNSEWRTMATGVLSRHEANLGRSNTRDLIGRYFADTRYISAAAALREKPWPELLAKSFDHLFTLSKQECKVYVVKHFVPLAKSAKLARQSMRYDRRYLAVGSEDAITILQLVSELRAAREASSNWNRFQRTVDYTVIIMILLVAFLSAVMATR